MLFQPAYWKTNDLEQQDLEYNTCALEIPAKLWSKTWNVTVLLEESKTEIAVKQHLHTAIT